MNVQQSLNTVSGINIIHTVTFVYRYLVHHGPDGVVEEILGLAVSPERGPSYPPALEVPLLGTGEGNKIMAYVVTSYSILNKTLSPYNYSLVFIAFPLDIRGERV